MPEFSIPTLRAQKHHYLPHLQEGRDADIARAVLRGESIGTAAKRFGLSVERIRQITVTQVMQIKGFRRHIPAPGDIDDLGIKGLRTRNAILNNGITSIQDLSDMTDEQLLSIPNFGRKALKEVRSALAAYHSPPPAKKTDSS